MAKPLISKLKSIIVGRTPEEKFYASLRKTAANKAYDKNNLKQPLSNNRDAIKNKCRGAMEEKHIWFTALAVFVIMGLFPPWERVWVIAGGPVFGDSPRTIAYIYAGFSFIFSPPPAASKICLSILLGEWALIWGIAGVLIYLKRKNM